MNILFISEPRSEGCIGSVKFGLLQAGRLINEPESPCLGHRFLRETVSHAVWLYSLSLSDILIPLLAERRSIVLYGEDRFDCSDAIRG